MTNKDRLLTAEQIEALKPSLIQCSQCEETTIICGLKASDKQKCWIRICLNVQRQQTLQEVWDMFNKHGISVIPNETDKVMNITISHGDTFELKRNVTFTRPSEVGILSWLPDKEWEQLKSGVMPKE